jgi:hypothetical protein
MQVLERRPHSCNTLVRCLIVSLDPRSLRDKTLQDALGLGEPISGEHQFLNPKVELQSWRPRFYQERSTQAERWLHRIYTEIEERFVRQPHHAVARRASA